VGTAASEGQVYIQGEFEDMVLFLFWVSIMCVENCIHCGNDVMLLLRRWTASRTLCQRRGCSPTRSAGTATRSCTSTTPSRRRRCEWPDRKLYCGSGGAGYHCVYVWVGG
jgi:hypothetical protein